MSSRYSPYERDDSVRDLKREEALHRSLRECTSRRLTHFNPCNTRHERTIPTLTSRVKWGNGNFSSRVSDKGTDNATRNDVANSREASTSPVQSEIDELMPSDDDDQSFANSRPSTGTSANMPSSLVPQNSPSVGLNRRGSPCCSESSDTERRQPNFPGNRDIIDSPSVSTSPSPPTRHNNELETPSPSSEIANGWPSEELKSSSSLGLHLHTTEKPMLPSERSARIGSWRVYSTAQDRYDSHKHGRPGIASHPYDSPRSSYLHYSPSMSSSAPPSPPLVLPPIHHLNATLPVHTGNTPGVMHWRYREPLEPHNVKIYRPAHGNFADDYDDAHSSTASPQSLPPLLPHINKMAQPYHPPHRLPDVMPMPVAPPLAPLPNPTRNKNAWKDYAQLVPGPNEQTEFRCVWRVGYAGEVTDHCGYTAKRHLVKRHIETRHLQFKDHICPYCGKAFPQRVSLMIHVNRHTGAKPHPCRYVDCDKTFSDPARRHKHMVEAHGYNPQGPRKRHRTVDSYHSKNFETVAPWTTKDENSHPKDAAAKS